MDQAQGLEACGFAECTDDQHIPDCIRLKKRCHFPWRVHEVSLVNDHSMITVDSWTTMPKRDVGC